MKPTTLPEKNLLSRDGEIFFFPELFTEKESARFFASLRDDIEWKLEPVVIFGRKIMQPRLTAWFGSSDYSYSGITMKPHAWTGTLLQIKRRIEPLAGVIFTSALLNQYRNEKDSVGWHRDNEKELGRNPVIGSVSFGETRTFHLRHCRDKSLKKSIELTSGSFLLMRGETQHFWEHSIPKMSRPAGPRINITFRILPN